MNGVHGQRLTDADGVRAARNAGSTGGMGARHPEFSRRELLRSGAALLLMATAGAALSHARQRSSVTRSTRSAAATASVSDSLDIGPWAGINANTHFFTDDQYVDAVNRLIRELNLGTVRMAMNNVGGRTRGTSFRWSRRDRVVDAHLSAGVVIHCPMSPTQHVEKGRSGAAWRANWRWFCRGVFRHYQDRIFYFSGTNEPDRGGPRISIADLIDMELIWREERDEWHPKAILESAPVSAPNVSYLRDMINAGITRNVDLLGIHHYGAGQTNEGTLNTPWRWMKQAHARFGHPVLPISSSETGLDMTAPHPSRWSDREYQAKWVAINRVQQKRYGLATVKYYSIGSTGGRKWDIAHIKRSPPYAITRWQPYFATISKVEIERGLRNRGFEDRNDPDSDWVVYWRMPQTASVPAEYARVAFLTDGADARSGSGYLRLTAGATNRVRQVVDLLKPRQSYTLSAWAKISAPGPTATLRALGFDHQDGEREAAQSTTSSGACQQLNVTFTPTRGWVVISLESTGGSGSQSVYWDDVALDPSGR